MRLLQGGTVSEVYNSEPMGEMWDILPSEEMDAALKQPVHAFRDALTATNGIVRECDYDRTLKAHLNQDPAKAINSFVQQDIEKRVVRKDERFWVSPDYVDRINAGLTQFSPLRSARAETSAHQVFFGLLHCGNPNDKEALAVAVKPCIDNPFTAVADWLNGRFAVAANLKTLDSVGFLVSNGVGYSLTKLDTTIETLDNTDWTKVFRTSENDARYQGQREQLSDIALEMANLHAHRVFHGDPQFKNVAINVIGQTFFIDWESAGYYRNDAPAEIVINRAAHDLKVLFRSMAFSEKKNGIGLIDDFIHTVQYDIFKKYVLDPYIEERIWIDENHLDELGEVESVIESYIKDGDVYKSFRRQRQTA
ncbi:MAG: hypothetical protein NVS1B7_1960 [Candidatus Saccharimonadales bacterium]